MSTLRCSTVIQTPYFFLITVQSCKTHLELIVVIVWATICFCFNYFWNLSKNTSYLIQFAYFYLEYCLSRHSWMTSGFKDNWFCLFFMWFIVELFNLWLCSERAFSIIFSCAPISLNNDWIYNLVYYCLTIYLFFSYPLNMLSSFYSYN